MPIIYDPAGSTAWASRDEARAHWADSKTIPDTTLDVLLEVATTSAKAYAPTLADGAVVPQHYMLGTVYQARETYAAAIRDGDTIGVGDYAFRARPLTGAVKQLLRPATPDWTTG